MSPCPVCGSDKLALLPGAMFRIGGFKADVCKNCGNIYCPEISKDYKKG